MTRSQWKGVSVLASNFAAVSFATFLAPILVGNFDIRAWYVIASGLMATIMLVWLTLISAKEGRL